MDNGQQWIMDLWVMDPWIMDNGLDCPGALWSTLYPLLSIIHCYPLSIAIHFPLLSIFHFPLLSITRGGLILVDSTKLRILIVLSILNSKTYIASNFLPHRDGAGQKCAAGIFLKFGTITISSHSSVLLR